VLNLTLECCDYVPDLPHCNDCVDRVEVIEYQGEKYVIYWADSLCSDALTIVYNYCDGTEFCREGGLLGETLNDCDQVSIDWGDGIVEGPFPAGNVAVSHTYSPGTYEAIMYVQEIGADGNACWEGVSRFEVQTGCTGKQPVEEVSVFRNYPNPFTEQTMIEHEVTFDGKNHPPGAYYYTIRAGDFFGTQKMVLVK